MSKLISIIVPVYNVEQYLDRCVESLVNQTYSNLEIVLVDDGSTDNCPKMCDLWKEKDPRIKVIHKKNGGLSDARNTAIRMISGEYYFLVDSDDCIATDAVEKLEACIVDEDVIVSEATIYEPAGIVHRIHTNLEDQRVYSGSEYSIRAISKGEWFAEACYNVYKTEFIKNNNLYFKVGILHEDIEYIPRLFLAAEKVKYVHYEFYKYIIRENSICGIKSEKHLNDLLETYSEWYKLNETILDRKLYKAYAGALSKYFISTVRQYKITDKIYPCGISARYLLHNSLNAKEFIKAVVFVLCRKVYVHI